jgi:hypothetical protein
VFLSACWQNNLSDGTSTAESIATAETPADPDDQEQGKEKTESEPKSDSIEKYKDIKDVLLALENEEYEKAIDLIKAMKTEQSEPDTEVVKINLENWSEYFSVEMRPTYRYDAMKNITEVSEYWYITLKPEYKEKLVSMSGDAGIEAAYEDEVYKIVSVDKATGAYETAVMDRDSLKAEYAEITGGMGGPDGPYFSDWEISSTYDLATDMPVMGPDVTALQSHTTSGGSIRIKDAEEWTQYIKYPKINVVRIEGELVLEKEFQESE